ncbi:hypothetical protein ACWDG1_38435 [Streptomyces sp. NPDC001177]
MARGREHAGRGFPRCSVQVGTSGVDAHHFQQLHLLAGACVIGPLKGSESERQAA